MRKGFSALAMMVAFCLSIVTSTAGFAADRSVTFHFYGAEDCPPCMAFKHSHLADVQAAGEAHGFGVVDNVIEKTADVPNVGSFGETDEVLRAAADQLSLVYPPIFFVTKDGAVLSVHDHDWQAALDSAIAEAS